MEAAPRTAPISVVLADDHPLIREGLRAMLNASDDVEVVAEASDGRQLLEAVEEHRPAVVLVDIRMPDLDGIEAVRRLRTRFPNVKAVMLTVHDEEAYVHEAVGAGAAGYLLKTVTAQELVKAIMAVAEGKAMIHPSVARKMIDGFAALAGGKRRPTRALSRREQDVLQLLADGRSNKEIARQLGIGAQTVKTHVSHIFTKLGASDRAGAVALAMRRGIVR